ncbi:MAG: hypothetical protein RR444_04510 [Oscillospiraceae bacterium]
MKQKSIIKIICLTIALITVGFWGLSIHANEYYTKTQFSIYIPVPKQTAETDASTSEVPSPSSNHTSKNNKVVSSNISSPSEKQQSSSQAKSSNPSHTGSPTPSSSNTASPKATSSDITSSNEETLQSSESPSSELVSNPPFESEQTSSEPVDSSLVEKNQQKASEISDKYDVSIVIALNETNFSSDQILSFATNPTEIRNGLAQISAALNMFPTGLFSQTDSSINFVLVSRTTSETIVNSDSTLIVPCFKAINTTNLNTYLLSILAKKLIEQVTPDYTDYNPSNFHYGYLQEKYNYNPLLASTGYFLSPKAQASAQDDLYETFMGIFQKTSLLRQVQTTSPFYEKLRYTCGLLVDWADCMGELPLVKQIL